MDKFEKNNMGVNNVNVRVVESAKAAIPKLSEDISEVEILGGLKVMKKVDSQESLYTFTHKGEEYSIVR